MSTPSIFLLFNGLLISSLLEDSAHAQDFVDLHNQVHVRCGTRRCASTGLLGDTVSRALAS